MPRYRNPGDDDHLQIDLSALDDAFAGALAPATRAIPDGQYHVQVEHVELITGPRLGHPLLKWKLRVRAPACAGALCRLARSFVIPRPRLAGLHPRGNA